MNTDLLTAAAIAKAWAEPPTLSTVDIDGEAEWFRRAMSDICDTAMPRSRPHNRRAVYWWIQEIQSARAACTKARRQFQRAHGRKSRDATHEDQLYRRYREAIFKLRQLILDAKSRAWDELVGTLNQDTWERPYRLVLGKLRTKASPVTETLNPVTLERTVDALFPACEDEPPAVTPILNDLSFPAITEEELNRALSGMLKKNTAPGPDGIPSRALALNQCWSRNRGRDRWIFHLPSDQSASSMK